MSASVYPGSFSMALHGSAAQCSRLSLPLRLDRRPLCVLLGRSPLLLRTLRNEWVGMVIAASVPCMRCFAAAKDLFIVLKETQRSDGIDGGPLQLLRQFVRRVLPSFSHLANA